MAYDKTDPNQNWLASYVGILADEFGLRDWKIWIMPESPDEGALACIRPIYGQKFAQLCLSENFWASDDACKRQTILHELLHCHFAQTQHWCESQMKSRVNAAFILMHETGVDGIAEAIAEKFPLPQRNVQDESTPKAKIKPKTAAK